MTPNQLNGLSVLVPRPYPMGISIAKKIDAIGGSAFQFPVIEILEPENFEQLDRLLKHLDQIDMLIFVSVSAVEGFANYLKQRNIVMPNETQVSVMGPTSAKRCKEVGLPVNFVPKKSTDTEGLLELLANRNLNSKQVVILRGQDGRGKLKIGLEQMGAQVEYVQCYRRIITTQSIGPLLKQFENEKINLILISSVSILESLIKLMGKKQIKKINSIPILTISARIQDACYKIGFKQVIVSEGVEESALLNAMIKLVNA